MAGKTWTKDDEGYSDHEDIGSKKGKKKDTTSKRNVTWKIVSPPRKSSRLTKGKTIINVIDEEDSVSSQSPVNAMKQEDSLELFEKAGVSNKGLSKLRKRTL